MSNTKTEDLKPTTLQEAKKAVYAKLCQNINPKEITQIAFLIDEKITRFNPAQIRKIREEFEPKIEQNNRDPDKALAFKLFKKRVSLVDVVIQTGLSYEYVKTAYQEYCRLKGWVTIPQHTYDNIMESIQMVDERFDTVMDIRYALKKFVTSYQELKKHVFSCSECEEDIPICDRTLEDAKEYLSSKWGHTDCIKN